LTFCVDYAFPILPTHSHIHSNYLTMRLLPATVLFSLAAIVNAERPIPLSKSIYDTGRIAFHSFSKPSPFSTWLQQTVNYRPIALIYTVLNKLHRGQLKNRGEAHITVITPPEYDHVLSKKLHIREIEAIAKKHRIQHAKFDVKCLGRGRAVLKGSTKMDTVYFIKVESKHLEQIRHAVWRAYVSKGGEPSHFDPELFWPHITVGFTNRDMFPEDGVYKGMNACWKQLKVVKNTKH